MDCDREGRRRAEAAANAAERSAWAAKNVSIETVYTKRHNTNMYLSVVIPAAARGLL